MIWFFLFCTFTPPVVRGSPSCSLEGQACLTHQDNLLDSQAGIDSLQDCATLCVDNYDCEFITYYGPDSFPLKNYCMMFIGCETLTSCEDCTTEMELCFEQCGQNQEGPLEDNVLEIIPDVESELNCKANCRNVSDCQAYTYHDNLDLALPNICFLLTEVRGPMQTCEHCSTGFPDCRNITTSSTTTSPMSTTPECQSDFPPNQKCPGSAIFDFPDMEDCAAYWHCDHGCATKEKVKLN